MRITNLKEIKEIAKSLLLAVSIETIEGLPLCSHPFTTSTCVPKKNSKNSNIEIYNLTTKEDFFSWSKEVFEIIDSSKNLAGVYMLICDSWKLTFLKFCEPYINPKTFSEYFVDAWIVSENPNMDANCSLKLLIKWFRQSKKEWLMNEKELKVYNELPEEFEVYRGVSVGRNPKGLSWTRNYKTAEWFANRFNSKSKKGYIQKALIKKENTFAYLNSREEDEIVVDSLSIADKIEII